MDMAQDQLVGDTRQDVKDALFDPANVNQALQVEETNQQFSIEPQELRLADDVQIVENGATTQFESTNVSNGLVGIETDSGQSTSRGRLETVSTLDYVSGLKAELGFRMRVVNAGSGRFRWGLGDDDRPDAAYFEYDAATDTHSAVLENTLGRVVIPFGEWDTDGWVDASNLATADITGHYYGYGAYDGSYTPLGTSPDETIATVDKIRFLWYGNGVIVFMRDAVDDSGRQLPRPVVAFVPTEEPVFRTPNMPGFGEVDNNGTADLSVAAIAGRQGSRAGREEPNTRPIGHLVTSPPQLGTGGWTNMAVLRRTDAGDGIPMDVVSVNVVGNDQPVDIEVRGRTTEDGSLAYDDGPNRDLPSGEVELIEVEDTNPATTSPGFFAGGGQISSGGGQGNTGAQVGGVDTPGTSIVRREGTLIRGRSLGGSATTPDAVVLKVETTG